MENLADMLAGWTMDNRWKCLSGAMERSCIRLSILDRAGSPLLSVASREFSEVRLEEALVLQIGLSRSS